MMGMSQNGNSMMSMMGMMNIHHWKTMSVQTMSSHQMMSGKETMCVNDAMAGNQTMMSMNSPCVSKSVIMDQIVAGIPVTIFPCVIAVPASVFVSMMSSHKSSPSQRDDGRLSGNGQSQHDYSNCELHVDWWFWFELFAN